jgi:predicted lipoprotein with Yx(FWY)xxD motif
MSTVGATTNHATKSVVVSTVKNAQLGTLLVSGKTLYTVKPSKTACTSACLKIWPALTLPKGVTKATAGKGVTASKLGSVTHSGVRQVTYSGKPLYYYVGDTATGQVHGILSDTWGSWSAFVTVKSANSTGTTAPSTGGVAF